MNPKVYVTRKIPEKPLALLEGKCDLCLNEHPLTKDELRKNLKDVDVCICTINDLIDREVIDCMQRAKIIANCAAGYNNIDFEYAASKGIVVTNTPGVLTNATADLAWGLLIAVARRIVEADKYTREGKFKEWAPTLLLGQEITGKTLGVIGAGRIGSSFIRKARGFDMRILYFGRTRNKELENETGAVYVDKNTLLRESDFVSIHVPLTSDTKYMIGLNELRMMKKNAILINTSRGSVVDEKALVTALKEEYIWGAGLDVYENEPEIEYGLLNLENVVLLPHIGSATTEAREKMVEMAVINVLAVLNGERPPNRVNF